MSNPKRKKNMFTKNPDRRIQTIPSPYYFRLVKALAVYTGESESRVVANMIKEAVDKIPIHEREKILNEIKGQA